MDTRPEPPIVPLRLGTLAPNEANLLVEPYDPVDQDWQRWFPDPSRVHDGNEVVPYLDAGKLFADMASAIRTATHLGHCILFSAWSVDLDLELVPGDPSSTLAELFASAGARGIEVFVLLNKFSAKVLQFAGFDNTLDAERLDALPGVHAIHDDLLLRVPLVGDEVQTHHQKLLVVSGEEGLVGFVGGVDLEPNRLTIVQDLHVRVRGPAARDLYRTLVERWDDHDTGLSPLPPLASTGLSPKRDLRAGVVRTYPNAKAHGGLRREPDRAYGFAPGGEGSYRELVLHAIAQAKKHIYVEDQYMVSLELAQAIAAAAPRLEFVCLLLAGDDMIDGELVAQGGWRRQEFLRVARSTGGRVWCFQSQTHFVHPKVWLFDDRFAIVGSGNVNRRGMTHDSEVACGIHDSNTQRRWFFAHELRMNLWARQTGEPPVYHREAMGALAYWLRAEQLGRVATYVPAAPRDEQRPNAPRVAPSPANVAQDLLWNTLVDPEGS